MSSEYIYMSYQSFKAFLKHPVYLLGEFFYQIDYRSWRSAGNTITSYTGIELLHANNSEQSISILSFKYHIPCNRVLIENLIVFRPIIKYYTLHENY
jgi:hypothetical protein